MAKYLRLRYPLRAQPPIGPSPRLSKGKLPGNKIVPVKQNDKKDGKTSVQIPRASIPPAKIPPVKIPSPKTVQVTLKKVEDEVMDIADLEDYVIVDIPQKRNFLARILFGDLTKTSAFKQFAIGGVLGWISGFLGNMVEKYVAFTVGCTLLLVQIANYNGYITVRWTKVFHCVTENEAKARNEMIKYKQSVFSKVYRFYAENHFLATGYCAGFYWSFFL